jgi:aldehyde:ferredoxin oxidoreductase
MALTYGWTGSILRINLSNNEVQTQSTEPYMERFIGGRGIISKLYWDEVSEKVEALHPDSPLMFMTGPLAGSGAIACSRWFVAGKSPLQYPDQFGLANVGGSFGIKLKNAGFDGIIVTGKAAGPVYLYIHDGKVEVKDAKGLWGLATDDSLQRLAAAHGDAAGLACIGPAGERLVRLSGVMSDIGSCGGSGFGAVMGSKNLKAVVADGGQKVAIARPDDMRAVNSRIRSLMEGRNLMDPNVDGIDLVRRASCPGCPAGCPRGLYKHVSGREEFRKNCQSVYMYYLWDMKNHGGESTADPFIATSLCDKYGLCTQEAGNLLYLLDLCAKNGVLDDAAAGITLSQIGSLPFFEQMVDMMLTGRGIGAALSQGTIRAAHAIGGGAVELLPKRMTPSGFNAEAYNPRYFIPHAVYYATEATSTMNQLHEIAFAIMKWTMWYATDGAMSPFGTDVMLAIAKRFWKDERAMDFSTYDGKAAVAAIIQNRQYAKETLIACDFLFPLTTADGAEDHVGDPDLESRLLSAVTGMNIAEDEYYKIGERVFNLQRAIQSVEGRVGRKDDRPNEFYFTDPMMEEGGFLGVFNPEFMLPGPGGELITRKGAVLERDKFEAMMDEYYAIRGWDAGSGLQTSALLESLGLTDCIARLRANGVLA